MRQTSFNRLGPYLKPAMQAACSKKAAVFAQLFGLWPELMRQTAANGTSPAKLTYPQGREQPGLLHIATQSAGITLELNYQATTLTAQINQYMGFQAIQGVRFFTQNSAAQTAKPLAPTQIKQQPIDSEHTTCLPTTLPQGLRQALGDLSWHMAQARAKNA
jgi:hypothetical protein